MNPCKSTFFVCLFLASFNTQAQTRSQHSITSVKEKDIPALHVQMEQVVVTGTGTHRRMADSPVPVAIFTQKDLAACNAATLEETLIQLSPNLSSVTNGMGTTLSLNGVQEDYLLILVNGRRLAGDDRYTRIPVANVKRVEILNGAASALYGSDAIGGVINIITNDSKSRFDLSNYTRYTTHGRFTDNVNADVHVGKWASFTSYQHNRAGNWQNNGIDEKGNPTGKPTSVGFYRHNVDQRFEYQPNDRLRLGVFGNWYDQTTRRPQNAVYMSGKKEKKAYSYNLDHETYQYGADASYRFSSKVYLKAEFYSDHFTSSYDYFHKSGKNEPGDVVTRKKTHFYNANVKGIFRLGSYHKLSAGLEYVNEQLKSQSDNIDFENSYTCALFAQDEIRLTSRLQAVAGVRYLYNRHFKNYATPNVSLMYRYGGLNLRASWATGFRTPTLSQLYATDTSKSKNRYTIGNPDLKPEKSHFYSLNAEYSTRCFNVSVTGFRNDMRDMINYRTLSHEELLAMGLQHELEQFDEIRQRDNIDKARTQGVSVQLAWYPGAGFSFRSGYTFLDTEACQRQADGSYEKTRIDKSIKHVGTFSGNWEHTWGIYRLQVNLQGRMQGKRYSQTYGYAPKFQQWDLNTRHSFRLRDFYVEPGIGVENLFNDIDDRPWNNNFSTLHPGRSVYASVTLRFKS